MITLPQRITLIDPGTLTDRYHNNETDWSTAVRTPDVPAWIQQRSSSASGADTGRTAVVTQTICFFGSDTDVRAGMRVEDAAGDVFEITGRPHRLSTPTGEHHIEAALNLVEG